MQIRARTAVRARAHPIVIGHRGASGHRPEHTLGSYWLAIQQGADFIEPDLVSTKDGVLVARHENEISGTTDVGDHPEFADRRTTKLVDDRSTSGFFSEDFTLAELKTLRATERLPDLRPANAAYDRMYTVPTLDEVIALAQLGSRLQQREIGIYPETKHPSYFDAIGLALEEPLVRSLHRHGYRGPNARVFIQSFEVANLEQLRQITRLPLVQLIATSGRPYDFTVAGHARGYADLTTPDGLAEIARYAAGVGVDKGLIIPRSADEQLVAPTTLIDDAHAAGLMVHAWTFRRENTFLPADFRHGDPSSPNFAALTGDLRAECSRFFELGLDGLFSDNPKLAVAARDAFVARTRRNST
jgi:glycerophosphoryl diester phosphodiesterase